MWKRLVLWVVDGHTPLDELERLRSIVRAWNRAQGDEKNVTLVVIHGTRSSMSAEERQSVARMIDETKDRRVASATVILGGGMIGALHRSILTGFSMLVPPPHPTRICATIPAAIDYLHPYIKALCGDVSAQSVEALVEDLHAEVMDEKSRRAGGDRE
jgi:hypothetical protein